MGFFRRQPEAVPSPAPAIRPTRSSATLWRKTDFRVHPLGRQVHAVHLPHGATRTLPAFAVEFALGCEQFEPLEKHVAHYAERHGWDGLQIAALRECLPKMIAAGLLISTEELQRRCAALRDPANRPPPINSIGIPTGGDRTELVERAIRSFVQNLRTHGRSADFLIADNTPRSNRPPPASGLAARLRAELACTLKFAGDAEKRRWAELFARDGRVSPEAVEFALFDPLQTGFACGANRNALLLQTAGEMFCSVDDDVHCRLSVSPEEPSAALACFSETDPFSRWLHADRESGRKEARWIDRDFLAWHETLLGCDLGEFFRPDEPGQAIDFTKAGDDFLRRTEGRAARIRATFAGHLGDPGIPTSAYYLQYEGENRRRLTDSEAHYRSVFGSRSVLGLVRNPAVGDASISPGMAMAFDHRELLPPFFPVLHAEDYSYGAALWHCCPGALLGHLPFAVCHDPAPGKPILLPSELGAENRVVIFEFAHLLRSLILHLEPAEHAGAAERMRSLGRRLAEQAALPTGDFAEFLQRFALAHGSERCEYLSKQLDEAGEAPDFWRADVEALIEHLSEALRFEDAGIPLDLKSGRTVEEARALIQQLLGRYAALLQEWPGMVEAAREFRERGEALFKDAG